MSDLKPFKHGHEGNHYSCQARMEQYGSEAQCCECTKHGCLPMSEEPKQTTRNRILKKSELSGNSGQLKPCKCDAPKGWSLSKHAINCPLFEPKASESAVIDCGRRDCPACKQPDPSLNTWEDIRENLYSFGLPPKTVGVMLGKIEKAISLAVQKERDGLIKRFKFMIDNRIPPGEHYDILQEQIADLSNTGGENV